MIFKAKQNKLKEIYERFEIEAHEYKKHAICKAGCSYCCTDVGSVDIITLEGLIIQERINSLAKPLKDKIKKKLEQNKRKKEKRNIARCPFLKRNNTCLIYDIRPFSCRQLYSVQKCKGRGPTVHRQSVELAKKTVRKIQRLDETGYSGHISFILYLLDNAEFRKLYMEGGFNPGKIMAFGKTHGIVINRMS